MLQVERGAIAALQQQEDVGRGMALQRVCVNPGSIQWRRPIGFDENFSSQLRQRGSDLRVKNREIRDIRGAVGLPRHAFACDVVVQVGDLVVVA